MNAPCHPGIAWNAPVLDIRDNGMGDVVLGCWLVESAAAAGRRLRLNPRRWTALAGLLGISSSALSSQDGLHATQSGQVGLRYEYRAVADAVADGRMPRSRFDLWAESLGLSSPGEAAPKPVRPAYRESDADRDWAAAQWAQVPATPVAPRVLIFPDTSRSPRRWPAASFAELVGTLRDDDWATAAMAGKRAAVASLGCWHWYGHAIGRVAAMIAQADLVIAGDTGPAHLAATIGTPTLALCGPTIGAVVFGHVPEAIPLQVHAARRPDCAPCHFAPRRGYGPHCQAEGCKALGRLDSDTVRQAARSSLAAAIARRKMMPETGAPEQRATPISIQGAAGQ